MAVLATEDSIMRKLLLGCLLMLVMSCTSGFAQGFPHVVGKWKFLNQTTDIAPVVLYTPQTGGIYRITFVQETTVGNGQHGAAWLGGASWTNEVGQNPAAGFYLATESPYSTSGTTVMRVARATPILFSTSSLGDTSNAEYNVYIVLEELSPL
jgi:hypothetical protein